MKGGTALNLFVLERALEFLRRSVPLGYDWRTPYSVKVGFLERYRITLHFPSAGDELVLTCSDVDRSKGASRAFEALVADELGIVIKPKVASAPHRRTPTRRCCTRCRTTRPRGGSRSSIGSRRTVCCA